MWKRLLVPHDFSPCAARALDTAVELAARNGASLALLHVSPLPSNLPHDAVVEVPGGDGPRRVDELTTASARRQLETLAAPLRERGLDVATEARFSTPNLLAAEILRAAGELGADAIVMGTHGREGLSHLMLGSIAEKVVRRAGVPVVTVRSPAAAAEPTLEEGVAEDELAG